MCKEIPLSNGQFALVDDQDYVRLSQYKWTVNEAGYAQRRFTSDGKRNKVLMHREIICANKGDIVDHSNGDKLDNRSVNLRISTIKQNSQNMKPRSGSSKYKGVYLENGKWRADTKIDKKTQHLGTYADERTAAAAYNSFAINEFGEYSRINCPDNPGETVSGTVYQEMCSLIDQYKIGKDDEIRLLIDIAYAVINGLASLRPRENKHNAEMEIGEEMQ